MRKMEKSKVREGGLVRVAAAAETRSLSLEDLACASRGVGCIVPAMLSVCLSVCSTCCCPGLTAVHLEGLWLSSEVPSAREQAPDAGAVTARSGCFFGLSPCSIHAFLARRSPRVSCRPRAACTPSVPGFKRWLHSTATRLLFRWSVFSAGLESCRVGCSLRRRQVGVLVVVVFCHHHGSIFPFLPACVCSCATNDACKPGACPRGRRSVNARLR